MQLQTPPIRHPPLHQLFSELKLISDTISTKKKKKAN